MKKLLFLLFLLPLTCLGITYININDGWHPFNTLETICFTEQITHKDRYKPSGLNFFVKLPIRVPVIYGSFVYSLYLNGKEVVYLTNGDTTIDRDNGNVYFRNIDLTQLGIERMAGEFNVLILRNVNFCLKNNTNSAFEIKTAGWYNVYPTVK